MVSFRYTSSSSTIIVHITLMIFGVYKVFSLYTNLIPNSQLFPYFPQPIAKEDSYIFHFLPFSQPFSSSYPQKKFASTHNKSFLATHQRVSINFVHCYIFSNLYCHQVVLPLLVWFGHKYYRRTTTYKENPSLLFAFLPVFKESLSLLPPGQHQ